MVKELYSSNISLPKAMVIGLLVGALSSATTYWVGWSAVQTSLARYDQQRVGDLALNNQVHEQLKVDVDKVEKAAAECNRQIGQVRVDVGALAAAIKTR